MAREYVIDGTRFTSLEEFYEHIGSVLVTGQNWGRNLNAFHDILSWPYFENEQPYSLVWRHADLSRNHLGYAEMVRWLEEGIRQCHSSGVPRLTERLETAKRAEGPTLFDMLVEIIEANSAYVQLVLV